MVTYGEENSYSGRITEGGAERQEGMAPDVLHTRSYNVVETEETEPHCVYKV